MNVWILECAPKHEPGVVLGVFATKELAEAELRKELAANKSSRSENFEITEFAVADKSDPTSQRRLVSRRWWDDPLILNGNWAYREGGAVVNGCNCNEPRPKRVAHTIDTDAECAPIDQFALLIGEVMRLPYFDGLSAFEKSCVLKFAIAIHAPSFVD